MMSRCYPGALRKNLRRMSSTEEENSALVSTVAQEEEDQRVSTTSHGKQSTGNQAFPLHRKRKKLDALANVFGLDTASLNNKRRREIFPPSSLTGVGLRGTSHYKYGESIDSVERKTHFNCSLPSSGLSRSVSPPSPSTEGMKTISVRNALSVVHGATSAQGSGVANHSSVTTSSTKEEEESTSLHSFRQTSKKASKRDNPVNLTSSIQAVGISTKNNTHDHHQTRANLRRTQRNRVKFGIRDRQHDGEVVSPVSKISPNLTAHDAEVDRVAGSILRDVGFEERSGKTATACVLNSGCSSVEEERQDRARRATDYGCSICLCDDCSELVHSSCSREPQSVLIGPDLYLSSCSDSIPSGLVTPYQPYRPMEPSGMKGSVVPLSGKNSGTVLEIFDAIATFTTNDIGKDSEVTRESSHAPSHAMPCSPSEQETGKLSSPTTECKSSGGHAHVHVDLNGDLVPTFVLSSGRMSKDEANKRGLRPSTIDDDFDQYFAQLML